MHILNFIQTDQFWEPSRMEKNAFNWRVPNNHLVIESNYDIPLPTVVCLSFPIFQLLTKPTNQLTHRDVEMFASIVLGLFRKRMTASSFSHAGFFVVLPSEILHYCKDHNDGLQGFGSHHSERVLVQWLILKDFGAWGSSISPKSVSILDRACWHVTTIVVCLLKWVCRESC